MSRHKYEEDDFEFDSEFGKNKDSDEDEAEEETLEELNTDENGHVIEGKPRKRRSRDDEYERELDYDD